MDLALKKVNLRKASSTYGGEYWGPCPECGGKDRFHVWPHQNEGKGGYWCRCCGKAGDNIQFMIDFEGMDFKSACAYLNINMPDHRVNRVPVQEKPVFMPAAYQSPAQLWQEKAEKFLTWSQERLLENKEALAYLASRGISAAAAAEARLGWNPGENGKDIFRSRKAWGLPELLKDNGKPRMLWIPQGLVIPYFPPPAGVARGAGGGNTIHRLRIRLTNEKLEQMRKDRPGYEPPRYYVVPGSSMATMVIGADRRAFVIVEAELDGIACAAACDLAGAVALGTLEGKPDASAHAVLKDAVQILNALDYGDQGGGRQAAARAMEWWSTNFNNRCDRWPVDKGKDPGEAFAMGTDLNSWIKEGLPPVLTIGREASAVKRNLLEGTRACPPSAGGAQGAGGGEQPPVGTSPLLVELWNLLRSNPGVKIINNAQHFTALRNGKFTSGRINQLLSAPEVFNYILDHPAEEIDWRNLVIKGV